MNVHRWRKLEGSDPATYSMIQRAHALQKTLIRKTEEVASKDQLIQEKEKLYVELKAILARQPGPEVAEQLTIYQSNLSEKQKQMKAMTSELAMHREQVPDPPARRLGHAPHVSHISHSPLVPTHRSPTSSSKPRRSRRGRRRSSASTLPTASASAASTSCSWARSTRAPTAATPTTPSTAPARRPTPPAPPTPPTAARRRPTARGCRSTTRGPTAPTSRRRARDEGGAFEVSCSGLG